MISLADIHDARPRIAPYVMATPMQRSETLSQELGGQVYLKLELFQKTGSFKPRGASNQILGLPAPARERGLVAFSGGNFAQAVAYAGQALGLETIICMPEYTPANYVAATRAYGARVVFAPDATAAIALAESHAAQGYALLHPFDNPNQMAGNGTLGLEILADLPGVTDIVVSIGGGGLIAGIIVAVKAVRPEVRIWGVETEGADAMARALRAGEVVPMVPTSLAKTLCAPYVAADALRICQRHLAGHLTVTDAAAIAAQQFLLERAKVLTELAAACTLAAARQMRERFAPGDQVVLLLCGGNESLDNLISYQATLSAAS